MTTEKMTGENKGRLYAAASERHLAPQTRLGHVHYETPALNRLADVIHPLLPILTVPHAMFSGLYMRAAHRQR